MFYCTIVDVLCIVQEREILCKLYSSADAYVFLGIELLIVGCT